MSGRRIAFNFVCRSPRETEAALHIDSGRCIFTETFSLCDRDIIYGTIS